MRKTIVPSGMEGLTRDWKMSPGHLAGGLLFLTGFNGAAPDGSVSDDPKVQIGVAFAQVEAVLSEAGLSFADIAEVTSYHVGLRDHLAQFKEAWALRMRDPYPAWTAIDVAGFATEGVIVELRVIAVAR